MALGWTVKVNVLRVDAAGAPVSLISEATTNVDVLEPWSSQAISGGLLSETGTIRIEISVLNDEGQLLGSYFEYVQVVPFKVEIRLRLTRRVIPSGGALRLRVANLGTTEVASNDAYRLQAFQDNRWQHVPQRGDFLASSTDLPPGHASQCQRVRIFKGAEPGLYRISKKVGLWQRRRGKVVFVFRYITETFRVRPRSGREMIHQVSDSSRRSSA